MAWGMWFRIPMGLAITGMSFFEGDTGIQPQEAVFIMPLWTGDKMTMEVKLVFAVQNNKR